MSETYVWTETRLRAIELFHDAPSAALEQRILDVFLEHPALVVEAVEHVGRRFASGQVRSPWVILAKHVEEAMRPLEDVHATDERDREKAIARVEQWVKVAGQHFDSEPEILDELFGDFGRLKTWRDGEPLKIRMLALWGELRSKGETIEREALERAEHRRETLATIAANADPEPVLDDPEPVIA